MQQTASLPSSKPFFARALHLFHRIIAGGEIRMQGLCSYGTTCNFLESALVALCEELVQSRSAQFRILLKGRSKRVNPEVQEQFYLVGCEALFNALRHSGATIIETEIQYSRSQLRVAIRDNGSGIDPQLLRLEQPSHCGLLGMRERARSVGAQFCIWSRRNSGTEVEICLPLNATSESGRLPT
jgi:signal transduction histidine kinase